MRIFSKEEQDAVRSSALDRVPSTHRGTEHWTRAEELLEQAAQETGDAHDALVDRAAVHAQLAAASATSALKHQVRNLVGEMTRQRIEREENVT
jgi:regulator of sirC expression with transglutaminase-like and TPR domain